MTAVLTRRELIFRTYAAVSPALEYRPRVQRPAERRLRGVWQGAGRPGCGRFGGGRPSAGPPATRRPGERLTGRGGVVVMFGTCFFGLLVAHWAHWGELADAVFFLASSLTAYYVRPGGLLPVVVSPPLLFFAACVLQQVLTSSGLLTAFSGTVVALANSAGWLFAGTGLTIAIALLRGLRSEVRGLVFALRYLRS